MKKTKKGLISIGTTLFMLVIILFSYSTTIVNSETSYITIDIIDANYDDLDNDGDYDDIIVKAVLDSNFEAEVLTFLYLDIILPSGLVHRFEFQVVLSLDGSHLLITIESYNTASEPGWYDCKLFCIVIYNDMLLFSESTYTFDPPTGNGPGEPTAIMTISSYN